MQHTEQDIRMKERYGVAPETGDGQRTKSLLQDLAREATTLFQQELALAKQEISETVHTTARNSAYIAAGGGVAWFGGIFLLLAATAGLFVGLAQAMAWYHALWLSPLIVGAVVTIVGDAMIMKGKKTIQNQHIVPDKTMETMRENKRWLQNEIK